MKKTNVYLDMDGTIADLYNEKNWLEDLMASNTRPFENAKPLISEKTLLETFPKEKYEIKILSMTPKNATREYCKRVEKVKDKWLDKYFPSLTKRIYLPYGNNKNLKNSKNAILVDDSEPIRNTYKGLALNPSTLWAWVSALVPVPKRHRFFLTGTRPGAPVSVAPARNSHYNTSTQFCQVFFEICEIMWNS